MRRNQAGVLRDAKVRRVVDEVGVGAEESRGRAHGTPLVVVVVGVVGLSACRCAPILIRIHVIVPVDAIAQAQPAVPEGPVEETGGYGLDEYNGVPPDEVERGVLCYEDLAALDDLVMERVDVGGGFARNERHVRLQFVDDGRVEFSVEE